MNQPARIIGGSVVGPLPQSGITVLQRRRQFTQDHPDPAPPTPYGVKVGFETDRFVVVHNRPTIFAHLLVSLGPIGERLGILGIEPDSFIEIADRSIEMSLLPIGYTTIVERPRVLRPQLDRLVVVADRAVVVAQG